MKWLIVALPLLLWMESGLAPVHAQPARRYIPPPLKVSIPFDAAWKGMIETLEGKEYELLSQDRGKGGVLTDFREFSSGPLTESHISKVGEKPKLIDGEWVRVLYQYDVQVQLIAERETVVTVNANIKALKRNFLGGDEWVEIPSSGRLEEELLTLYGRRLFGEKFSLAEPRKGFWERMPGYVPEADVQPQIVGPERKRP